MKAQVKMYSSRGHDVLLEYDTDTADMKEVNTFVDRLEEQFGGRTFSDKTSEVVNKITPETGDVTFVRPIAGG